jgi:hypothetical protein
MSYANLYFGKDLTQITYQDVEDYFTDAKDESNKIEYKSYNPKSNEDDNLNKIFTSICAMLNSEGGLIVWGAPQGQTKDVNGKKVKYFTGALTPLPFREKDSFINKATDKITPAPTGIKFQPIQGDSGYIYIIEVEKSFYSPHQFEYVYYMRIDGQNKPAPHYFVEALFRKVTFPKLEGHITFQRVNNNYNINSYEIPILLTIQNQSRLQNEYDIYLKVAIKGGYLRTRSLENARRENVDEYSITSLTNQKDTLYHNEPLIREVKIIASIGLLSQNDHVLEVNLYFGGKQSPLMVSTYEVYTGSSHFLNDINKCVTVKKLNTYIYQEEYK